MFDANVPFVVAPPMFARRDVAAMIKVAQVPGSKLLDFSGVRRLEPVLFAALARRWRAPAGLVPRLALVFSFANYAVARSLARTATLELARRGTALRLFYSVQRVSDWVRGRAVGDDAPGALAELETSWDGSFAHEVIDGALDLVRRTGSVRRATLLVRLGWLARRTEGPTRGAQLAREALATLGDALDPEACAIRRDALRVLAGALFELGDEAGARLLFGELAGGHAHLASFVEMALGARRLRAS